MFEALCSHRSSRLCGLLLLLLSTTLQAEQLLLVGDEFCPYNCDDRGGYQGYMVDLLNRIFSEQGIDVEYRLTPWSRALQMINTGKADILLANSRSNSPDPELSYVMGQDSACFYVREGAAWRYETLTSLESVRLGVIQGYHYDSKGPLDSYIRANTSNRSRIIHASGSRPLQSNINMLLAGRLDAIVDNCNVAGYNIKRLDLGDQVVNAGRLSTYHDVLYVSFSLSNPESRQHLEQLQEGMRRLRNSKQLESLLDKYGVQDWEHEVAAQGVMSAR